MNLFVVKSHLFEACFCVTNKVRNSAYETIAQEPNYAYYSKFLAPI